MVKIREEFAAVSQELKDGVREEKKFYLDGH